MKITSRMRWILARMREDAYLKEIRDAFMEESRYELRFKDPESTIGRYTILGEVSERMIDRMVDGGLIKMGEALRQVYKHGRFITQEAYYYLPLDPRCEPVIVTEGKEQGCIALPLEDGSMAHAIVSPGITPETVEALTALANGAVRAIKRGDFDK